MSLRTEFREFALKGNVMDLAVGVIIGAAFGKIVTSLVEGIIMPPIGLALGRIDVSSLFYVLDTAKGVPASLADAKAKGIPVIAWGQFINDIIGFVIVAFTVFMLVKYVNRLKSGRGSESAAPSTKECPYCVSAIAIKATRWADTPTLRPFVSVNQSTPSSCFRASSKAFATSSGELSTSSSSSFGDWMTPIRTSMAADTTGQIRHVRYRSLTRLTGPPVDRTTGSRPGCGDRARHRHL